MSSSWQAQRISKYLLPGCGVWWRRAGSSYEFLDGHKALKLVPGEGYDVVKLNYQLHTVFRKRVGFKNYDTEDARPFEQQTAEAGLDLQSQSVINRQPSNTHRTQLATVDKTTHNRLQLIQEHKTLISKISHNDEIRRNQYVNQQTVTINIENLCTHTRRLY